MERRILKLNWQDIKNRDKSIDKIILPMGTIEAHGIASMGTDVEIPEKLSIDIADKINAFVLPTMPYGITSSLLPYAGSIDIGEDTLKQIVLNIAKSIKKDNYKYFIIMNGHGGNNKALSDIKKEIYKQTGMWVIICHWWEYAYSITERIFNIKGGHSGVDENAMMLYIDKNTVKQHNDESSLHYSIVKGIETIPSPAPAIDYDENTSLTNRDPETIKIYYNEVLSALTNSLEMIIKKIENMFY